MDDLVVIKPTGGLCNYLRVLMSYYEYCKKNNKQLLCIWYSTVDCPGFFLDYFEPLPNTKIIQVSTAIDSYFTGYTINYEGYECHPDYTTNIYTDLKLIPAMQDEISKFISKIPDKYSAVHIRQTDFIPLAISHNNYVPEYKFNNFFENTINKYFYIATDNNITQNTFIENYPEKIYYYSLISDKPLTRSRFTDLKHAIIDLYICVAADEFMGTPLSSFSELIKELRAQRRK